MQNRYVVISEQTEEEVYTFVGDEYVLAINAQSLYEELKELAPDSRTIKFVESLFFQNGEEE